MFPAGAGAGARRGRQRIIVVFVVDGGLDVAEFCALSHIGNGKTNRPRESGIDLPTIPTTGQAGGPGRRLELPRQSDFSQGLFPGRCLWAAHPPEPGAPRLDVVDRRRGQRRSSGTLFREKSVRRRDRGRLPRSAASHCTSGRRLSVGGQRGQEDHRRPGHGRSTRPDQRQDVPRQGRIDLGRFRVGHRAERIGPAGLLLLGPTPARTKERPDGLFDWR
mmetsp:Transcript_16926/g.46477  ORF Transcript_16926/g.46477 Transcript_16926/m.46477 type:complete len:219 (+) Transcript_16926:389-1045(+)